jgi:hypothetical protein
VEEFASAAGGETAQVVAGSAASAVAGGVGSVLGGGKFANGAVTGAFSYALGRVLPSANDNFTEKNGLGKHLADSWRKGKYAAKPLDGTETKLAGSVVWGAGATTAAGIGAEASGGKAFNLGFGDEVSDFGVFYATGVTTGVNISADVFIGYVKGDLANLYGDTFNQNYTAGPVSVTIMHAPDTAEFLGFTVGVGPSRYLYGYSGAYEHTFGASIASGWHD